jgi:hypothetical protein
MLCNMTSIPLQHDIKQTIRPCAFIHAGIHFATGGATILTGTVFKFPIRKKQCLKAVLSDAGPGFFNA